MDKSQSISASQDPNEIARFQRCQSYLKSPTLQTLSTQQVELQFGLGKDEAANGASVDIGIEPLIIDTEKYKTDRCAEDFQLSLSCDLVLDDPSKPVSVLKAFDYEGYDGLANLRSAIKTEFPYKSERIASLEAVEKIALNSFRKSLCETVFSKGETQTSVRINPNLDESAGGFKCLEGHFWLRLTAIGKFGEILADAVSEPSYLQVNLKNRCAVSPSVLTTEYRRNNAVVLYEFNNDSSRIVRDTASSRFGPPLDLKIHNSEMSVAQLPDHLSIKSTSLIASEMPATKLLNTCQTNQELTVEVVLQNNESVELRIGRFPASTIQPPRIVSFAENIGKNNFIIGQSYEGFNQYAVAANTNEPSAPDTVMGLNNFLRTMQGDLIIPALEPESIVNKKQTLIFTVNKTGVSRLYASDRDGNLNLRQVQALPSHSLSRALFESWSPIAKLSLGNTATDVETVLNDPVDYRSCTASQQSPYCGYNSRHWKGNLYLVAVYCNALTDKDIFGISAN